VLSFIFVSTEEAEIGKLEATDVLPDTNRMQAAERAKNAVFLHDDLGLSPFTLTSKLV